MGKGFVDTIPMNIPKKPLQSSSIASRCMCGICGKRPSELRASGGEDGAPVTITARCCGQGETRTVRREELLFTQKFFVEADED